MPKFLNFLDWLKNLKPPVVIDVSPKSIGRTGWSIAYGRINGKRALIMQSRWGREVCFELTERDGWRVSEN